MDALIVPGIVTLFAVIALVKCVVVVPAGNAFVVERLGRYDRTLPPGLHVLPLFTDRVAHRFSLEPRVEELSDQCVTSDNIPVRIVSTFRAQIADPERAAYATAHPGDAVKTLVRTHQRQQIGQRSWEDVRLYTRELESAVVSAAAGPAAEMGITLHALDVRNVERVT